MRFENHCTILSLTVCINIKSTNVPKSKLNDKYMIATHPTHSSHHYIMIWHSDDILLHLFSVLSLSSNHVFFYDSIVEGKKINEMVKEIIELTFKSKWWAVSLDITNINDQNFSKM